MFFSAAEDFANFNAAYIEDGNTFGINSRRYLCHVVGRELGSWGGRIGGAALGGLAGSGAGSVPLGIAGGIAGDYYGGELGELLSDLFLTFLHTSSLNNIYKITFIRYETICNETIIFSILCRKMELSHPDANTWTFYQSCMQMAIFLESVWLYSGK